MKRLFNLLFTIFVLWQYEHDVVDVLEYQLDGSGEWHSLAGPYHLTEDKASYLIPVYTGMASQVLFRVRRDWGEPLVPVNERPPKP